jgi:hypothetical protein
MDKHPGSDIDLLMLLDGLDDPVADRERYFLLFTTFL